MDKLPLTSQDLLAEKITRIREEFQEVFSEGKIDFERLKMALGEFADNGRERFGLTWAGKSEAIRNIQTPSLGTLLPIREESVNFDVSENLIIEGDNLEALKLLQKSYHGKIKMIYIDPPYNTGNEFIYPDNFREGLDDYLRYSGQVDDEGIRLSTNTETDGRFHSKWLNMMYPRLFLARNLLRDDGVIFVSIGDNEVHNLRATMNEIFGEENFKAHIHWQRKYSVSNNYQGIASITDHILAYSKTEQFQNNLLERTEESISRYSNPDNDPRGPWKAVDYLNQASPAQRPNLCYDIINPNTKEVIKNTKKAWKYSRSEHQRHVEENRIWWGKNGTNTVPALKLFLSEVRQGMTPHDWWSYEEVGHTDEAKKETEALLGPNVFDTPKPVRLIRRMLELATNPETDDVILDFFAGSGTTAQAVMEQNKDDGGNRKFILVQLPEPIESDEFSTIVDITKERVKRAIDKMHSPNGDHIGFKFFRLSSSNFKTWEASQIPIEPDELSRQLRLFADNIRHGRTQQDLLYEIVLKSGLPITASIAHLQVGEQSVYSIANGTLLICLEDDVSENTLTDIVGLSHRNVVCLDAAFHGNDNLKTNTKLLMESHGIEFRTV